MPPEAEEAYDYWIRGKALTPRVPSWSVLHNIFWLASAPSLSGTLRPGRSTALERFAALFESHFAAGRRVTTSVAR
jgi:hypothetical protein